jgi:hypothetical protein
MTYTMHITGAPRPPGEAYLSGPSRGASDPRHWLEHRLKTILRVRGLSPRLNGAREADFRRIVGNARHAIERGDAKAIAAASLALDLLSLELCED